eukprot:CAMPEP_0198244924 /NCGR_PEP_ID=MMETSP1446-20131203/38287_1 /TAXON_ID=1461542 ORGANISM="Unidentified sp, Strain CCMP2111" /NCGR_SAMPLE_ID=MMETSP1446 /ASSEMBLY_ACC=CAM_ASM_001112 /LENGTH=155 /DNA_ID=CAMNT_0043929039 /DNA_START=1 /DNA_END=468 /DNA_ORIENTATION=+
MDLRAMGMWASSVLASSPCPWATGRARGYAAAKGKGIPQKGGKADKKKVARTGTRVDPALAPFLPIFERPERGKVDREPFSDEVLAENSARAKEYSRMKMKQHREWQKDMSMKLKLKWEATEALPEDLKAHAMVPDDTPFPLNRRLPTDFPPNFK